MKKNIFILCIVCNIIIQNMNASDNIKVFRKTIKQHYFDKTNEEIARVSTLKKIELELSKEVGEYISTNTVISNSKIVKDDIIAISSSILNTKIVNEVITKENDQYIIELTIESTIDKISLEKSIEEILNIESNLEKVKDLKLENDKFLKELIDLEISTKGFSGSLDNQEIIENFEILELEKMAVQYSLINDYDNAIKCMSNILELDNKSYEAYLNRGVYLVKKNEKDKAIQDFKNAIKFNSKSFIAFTNLSNIFTEKNDYTYALELANKAIIINPKYAPAYYSKGNILARTSLYEEAIKNYDYAISIEKNHFYYNSRAIANISLRKYIFALNDFNEAININSEYLNAYKNRSRLYYQLGDFPKSIKDAQKACTLGDCSLLKLNEKNTN